MIRHLISSSFYIIRWHIGGSSVLFLLGISIYYVLFLESSEIEL